MEQKHWGWALIVILVIGAVVLWRRRSGVQVLGGGSATSTSAMLASLAPLTQVATAEVASQQALSIESAQAAVQNNALQAAIDTAQINAGAAVAAANRAADAQSNNSFLNFAGNVLTGIIAHI